MPKNKRKGSKISDSGSNSGANSSVAGKRRGRKSQSNQSYFSKAEEKIAELKKKLLTAKADGFDVKQR